MKQIHLEAKIKKPKLAANIILREELLQQLRESSQKLVIFHATMGYGKSVLMNLYGNDYGNDQAWYHLTVTDNDTILFLEYLTASVKKALPDFSFCINQNSTIKSGNGIGSKRIQNYGQDFAAALQKTLAGRKFCLMLDDFQVIESAEIYGFLEVLLSVLPEGIRILLTTRGSLPQFAFRLVLSGEAWIATSEELKFSEAEIEQVMAGLPQIQDLKETVKIIDNYIEGWPAGVMFLYLYLKSRKRKIEQENIHEICRKSMIHDFIMYELFKKLSFEIQQFLVQTSVLEYLQSDVCNAVTGLEHSESMLNYLISEGIFIQKIENKVNVYRYHHLFQAFLQNQLDKREKQELCSCAAKYYLKSGDREQAVEYAIAAKDAMSIMQALEKDGDTLLREGKLQLFCHWKTALEQLLSQELFSSQVLLLTARYWHITGEEEKGFEFLNETMKQARTRKEEQAYIHAFCEKAEWNLMRGEAREVIRECSQISETLKEFHKNWFLVNWMKLKGLVFLGDEKEAVELGEYLTCSREQYTASQSLQVKEIRKNSARILAAFSACGKELFEQLENVESRESHPEVWDILATRSLMIYCEAVFSGGTGFGSLEGVWDRWGQLARKQKMQYPISAYTAYGFLAEGYRMFREKNYKEAMKELVPAFQNLNQRQMERWFQGKKMQDEIKRLFIAAANGYKGKESHFHLIMTTFGEFQARILETGEKIKWRTKKAQKCVAYLVQYKERRFSREALISELWKEEIPANEAASFHNLLSSIRKSLSLYGLEDLICYDGERYFIKSEYVYTDLVWADKIVTLANGKNGEGLADMELVLEELVSAPYLLKFDEYWAGQQRDYYQIRLDKAMFLIGDYYRKQGYLERAEEVLKKTIEQIPYMEEAQQSLMLLYGQKKDFLSLNRAYQWIREFWENDTGVVPEQITLVYDEMLIKCQEKRKRTDCI